MMNYDELLTYCELPPVVTCCFGAICGSFLQMWTRTLRIEQLQTLPPGLQMMLLNTEADFRPDFDSCFPKLSGAAKAIAGGYEERLIEARSDRMIQHHGANMNCFDTRIQIDSN